MNRMMIEQETTITMNREEAFAILGTCDPKWMRKMARFGIEPYRKDGGWFCYYVDKKLVSVRKSRKPYTEEQKVELQARLK